MHLQDLTLRRLLNWATNLEQSASISGYGRDAWANHRQTRPRAPALYKRRLICTGAAHTHHQRKGLCSLSGVG